MSKKPSDNQLQRTEMEMIKTHFHSPTGGRA